MAEGLRVWARTFCERAKHCLKTVKTITSRRKNWMGHAVLMTGDTCVNKILIRKPEEKTPLQRPQFR